MSLLARGRPSTSSPGDGSRTITVHDSQPREESEPSDEAPVGALRLRGGPRRPRQRVAWGEDVVDNEGCEKKKSKICCIYHKPKRFDESSSESSSESDSDSSCDDRAQPPHRHRHHRHGSSASPVRGGGREAAKERGGLVHKLEEEEPNAYEIVPGGKKGKRRN